MTLTDAEGYVDYSYINHLVVNGGVTRSFGDEVDTTAAAIPVTSTRGARSSRSTPGRCSNAAAAESTA